MEQETWAGKVGVRGSRWCCGPPPRLAHLCSQVRRLRVQPTPSPGSRWPQKNGPNICGSEGTFLRREEARLAQGVALLWVWNVVEPVGQASLGPRLQPKAAIFRVF